MSLVSSSRDLVEAPPRGLVSLRVRCIKDLSRAIQRVVAAMARRRIAEQIAFGVRLALEEALVNALKHGHGYDRTKAVRLRYRVDSAAVWAEVEDDGPGFDPNQVVDPRVGRNRYRPSGRGLLLMRQYLTSVQYNTKGNCVTLYKSCSEESEQADTSRAS